VICYSSRGQHRSLLSILGQRCGQQSFGCHPLPLSEAANIPILGRAHLLVAMDCLLVYFLPTACSGI
jgi:hypothetical protein